MVKLDDIIKGHINERDEDSTHAYARLLRIAIDGLKLLSMDVSGVNKTAVLPVDENTYTSNLPRDFIKETRVSVCIGERLYPLQRDETICINNDVNDCGEPIAPVPIVGTLGLGGFGAYGGYYYNNPWRAGEYLGGQFNTGGGVSVYGRYRIDIASGWIQYQSMGYTEVVLEYLAQPQMVNGEFFIHEYDVEALNAYIYWASIRSKTTIGGGEKERAAMEFKRQKQQARQRHQSFTLADIYQTLYRNFKLSPKT